MKRDNKIKKLLMMVGVETVAVGMVLPAAGGRSCVHFRPDSKNYLYKTGETAVVEASFTDKAGNALKQGIVELWADDGWTNRVWTRTIDLAKDSQPVRMELSRSTPGADAQAALATDANRAALAALGLDKIAAALFAANDAARAAMESRSDERSSRAEEKAAGTTPELRKTVAALLVAAARRVNAVNEIAPTEAAAAAITKVAALVEEYKLVASQFKGKKKADPEPESAPEATTIS